MTFDPSMWLENVRVVPTIGISWKPTYETASNVLDHMRPMVYRWDDAGVVRNVTADAEKASVSVQRTDGLLLSLSTENLTCQFVYENSIENHGDLTAPVVKELRALSPYAELIGEVKALVHEVLPELMQSKGGVRRRPHRVGVVADGVVKGDMLPPGFEAYLCHLGQPWGQDDVEVRGDIIATLRKSDQGREVCHHLLKRSRNKDEMIAFKLDWQWYFSEPQNLQAKALGAVVDECTDKALEYFGKFGTGDLNYGR